MAIRYKNLAIRRDELTVIPTQVPEWEVPLLHLVHGEGAVQVAPGEPWSDAEPPAVEDEYQRLYSKYKTPPEENGAPGQRAVVLVYGPFGASPLLRQAIEAATFERTTDLLGIADLQKAADAADASAAQARARLNAATAASEGDDEDQETADEKAARKRERAAAKAAKAAQAKTGSTPVASLL